MFAPKTLGEYKNIVQETKNDTTFIIAGGTDLIIRLNHSKTTDYKIIDITKLNELKQINFNDDFIRIGALVTMTELIENEELRLKCRALYLAARELGSQIIRNRATIGGNICNASQSADCSLVLFTYEAKIRVLKASGEFVEYLINDFIVGREKTVLEKGDLVIEILIPNKPRVSSFGKVGARKAVTISKISCSISYENKNNKITNPIIYFGAVGVKAIPVLELMDYFKNKSLDEIDIKKAQEIAHREVETAISTRPSRFYKRVAVEGLIEDIVRDLK